MPLIKVRGGERNSSPKDFLRGRMGQKSEQKSDKVIDIYDDVEAYVKFLRGTRGLSETTIKHYLSYYVHFKKKPVSQRWIERFLEKRNNNKVCRAFIKCYLEFIKREREFRIPHSKTGRSKKRIINDMSQKEVDLMLHDLRDYAFKDWLFFNLLYYGALRRIELINIKIRDFYWEDWFSNPGNDCYLRIFGKGKKEREVLIPAEVMEKIISKLESKGFLSGEMDEADIIEKLKTSDVKMFSRLGERDCLRLIYRVTKSILGQKYRTHEVRHTRATQMWRAGVPIKQIQIYLGHAHVSTTEIYLHIDEKETLRNISNLMRKYD